MKMSNSQKQEMLYQSFEILKDDWDDNYINIQELIGKMAVIDINIAFEMWKYILKSNLACVSDNAGYLNDNKANSITSMILSEFTDKCDNFEVANLIVNDEFLLKQVYALSANIDGAQTLIISEFINKGHFDKADKLLQLIYKNPNNQAKGWSCTFGEIIQKIIDDLTNNDDAAKEFIHEWIQRISDPKDRAKANIRFLNIV